MVFFFVYNTLMLLAVVLLMPVWIQLVLFSGKHRRTFFQRLAMRPLDHRWGGVKTPQKNGKRIWIHALSVGEVLSAEPLVRQLAERYGRRWLVFTASTMTGFETATRVISPHVSAVRHFPYDTIFSVTRALRVIRPDQVVIVETDIWPNFLTLLSRRRIPVCLVNARLSDRSFSGYKRIAFLMGPLLSRFQRIGVQTEVDRERFRRLGVSNEKLVTTGNLKFDQASIAVAEAELQILRERLGVPDHAAVWVAGSTHAGEEAILAETCTTLRLAGIIDLFLIVAPRDPTRAMEVVRIFNHAGIIAATLGQIENNPGGQARVAVIDRIGLLRKLYALADVAFVGGSLVRQGGHNPLEAASVAKPVLFGPHTDDFRWICHVLEDAGGGVRVEIADQLATEVGDLIKDQERAERMGRCARTVFFDHQGAVTRTMALIRTNT